jgi:hypothetical protein
MPSMCWISSALVSASSCFDYPSPDAVQDRDTSFRDDFSQGPKIQGIVDSSNNV